VLASKADQFIQDSRYTGKPFALEVATFAPHTPRVPAPMDRGTFPTTAAPRVPAFAHQPANAPSWFSGLGPLTPYDIERIDHGFQRRVEAVQAVDRMVGHLEGLLAQQHQLANTYFVFSSDNGYHMGEYGLMPGKQTAFDTDIRVPLIVAGPGVPVGRTIDAMASSIDLAPTFLQIAGARPSDQPDGTSLLDLLHGGRPPADWQRAVLIEHHGPQFAPQDPDVQSARSGAPPSYEAMRTADSLYVEYVTGEREYYDLRRDPSELHNVVSNLPPRRLAALHTRLMALAHCHGTAECQQAAAPNGRV
jgi:arylsulfatase A-like enzyme